MKNHLIIGASSGVGKQLASILSSNVEQVDGTYCSSPAGTDSDNLRFHSLDVRDEAIDLDFAPDRLHGLVYCPGTINLRPFARIKPKDFVADLICR